MLLTVNGVSHELAPAGHETLLALLRDRLHLTGAKLVCGRGECGACTVLVDDGAGAGAVPVYSCLALASACDGHAVTTVEGLARAGALHPLQEAFIEHDALQCGFCTPGMVMSCAALVERKRDVTLEDVKRAVSGNLCRCGTYPKVFEATLAASKMKRAGRGDD